MKEIDNRSEILKLLQEQQATGGIHSVWIQYNKNLRQVPFSLISIKGADEVMTFSFAQEVMTQFVDSLFGGEKLKVFLNDVSITFHAEVLSCEEKAGTLKVSFPEVVYFQERRQDERYRPEGLLKIGYPIERGQSVKKDILDISKGGLSFLLSREDRFPFKDGEELSFDIHYRNQKVELPGQVVKILKVKPFVLENIPYGDRLISLRFTSRDEITLKRFQMFLDSLYSGG